ncbi:MAG: hypothetical protein ACR2L3_04175 [Actinomycetota bacterium]
MRISVEAWSAEYSAGLDIGAPEDLSVENVLTDCEDRPWAPVPPASEPVPPNLFFVDGTRRIDARVYLSSNGSAPVPGVAGSVGVGAVRCCGGSDGQRASARIEEMRVSRHLAVGDGIAQGLSAGPGLEYKVMPVPGQQLDLLVDAVHNHMRNLEAVLARELSSDGSLVFVDGPLALVDPGPQRIVGYIKSHSRRYLPPEKDQVLGELGCGHRTPLFAFGEKRSRYSWYVRLCAQEEGQHNWYGIARCEVPAALSIEDAIHLADLSTVILPAYASRPYWDHRAPQNLVPVAGLEKRLRHLLGDRNLVYRKIRSAARLMPEVGPVGA